MLTLYTFRAAFGVPDLSPFVTKVATWLRMAGIPYRAAPGNPLAAPKGKLPYIDHDGQRVADSTFIIEHCARAFGVDLDAGLGPRERALARAVQSMLEEHLYFTTLYLRWQDPRGWRVLRPEIEALGGNVGVPRPLRPALAAMLRRRPRRNAWGQGMGRHSVEQVEALAVDVLDATATLLGDGPYFFGETPRTLDATAWAFLQGVLRVPLENRVRAHALGLANVVAYCDRVEARYWKTDPAT